MGILRKTILIIIESMNMAYFSQIIFLGQEVVDPNMMSCIL